MRRLCDMEPDEAIICLLHYMTRVAEAVARGDLRGATSASRGLRYRLMELELSTSRAAELIAETEAMRKEFDQVNGGLA